MLNDWIGMFTVATWGNRICTYTQWQKYLNGDHLLVTYRYFEGYFDKAFPENYT